MKKLSFKNIFNIIVLILLINSFFSLIPIKYNKVTKELMDIIIHINQKNTS